MLDTAVAQFRLAIAMLTGRPIPSWALSILVAGARATRHEFGAIGAEGAQAGLGSTLHAATGREVQLRVTRPVTRLSSLSWVTIPGSSPGTTSLGCP